MPTKSERTGGRFSSRKRLLGFAALAAAAVLGVGLVAYYRFDPAYFQQVLMEQMERRFDLEITIGRTEIKLWPSLGLELDDLEARRRGPGETEPILTVKATQAFIRTIPLFWGRFEISRIVLEEPDLRVVRGPEGRLDVVDLLAGDGEKNGKKSGGPGGRLFVTKTEIRRGKLTISERNAAGKLRRTRVESFDLEMENLTFGEEPEFKLDVVMGEPSPGARIRLVGRAGRLERDMPFGELPLDVRLEADRFAVGPFRGFLPEKWRDRIRGGVLTSDLSIEGSFKNDIAVKGDIRIMDADYADHYSIRGNIIGKIDWRGAGGKTRGKADLRLDPGAFVKGSMEIDGKTDIRADFTSHKGDFDARLKIDATDAAYRQGGVFEKPPGTRLTLEGRLGKGAKGLVVEDADGKLGELPFTGSAEIGHAAGPGRSTPFDLHFMPEKVDLATLQDYVDALRPFALGGEADVSRIDIVRRPEEAREYQVSIEMRLSGVSATILLSDGRAHTVRNLYGGVSIVPGRLISEDARGEINGAPISFKGDVTEFMAMIAPSPGRPRAEIRLDAWGDQVDLDRLLEPAAQAAPPSAGLPAPGAAQAAPADAAPAAADAPAEPEAGGAVSGGGAVIASREVDFLDRFFVTEGTIRAERATYAKQPLSGLLSKFEYHNPVLRLSDTRFAAHEGDWKVTGTIALNGTTTFDLGVKVDHARVESLSRAFSEGEREPTIFGMLDGEFELHGQGTDLPAWEKTLRGTGHIVVRDGRLPGFNIFETVVRAILGVFAKVIPVGKIGAISRENTFERFEQSLRIERGRVWSDDVRISTVDYLLEGAGSTGLDRTLDYKATVALTPEGTQKMITLASLPILSGAFRQMAPIPVRITGTTDKPVILPNTSVISMGSAQAILQGVGEKAVGGAKDAVQGVGRILGVGSNGAKEKESKGKPGSPGAGESARETAPPDATGDAAGKPTEKRSGEEENPDLVDQGMNQLEKLLGW